jgi:hypothetical protein
VCLLLSPSVALVAAASDSILKCADSFAILSASGILSQGRSKIFGDVGVKSGAEYRGFPPGQVLNGFVYLGGPIPENAQLDASAAYRRLRGLPSFPIASATEGNLGGLELTPGIYALDASARLNGTLQLNARGKEGALFIFQIATSLTTAPGSAVVLLNRGRGDAVYWQVGNSAILGKNTSFEGAILAQKNITMDAGAKIRCGRAFSLTGAVVMDHNYISIACESPLAPLRVTSGGLIVSEPYRGRFTPLPESGSVGSTPEPDTFWLAATFLALLTAVRFHRRGVAGHVRLKLPTKMWCP